ncbi:MAG: porphobilinogen synthase [Pseudomonadota bacterium]|jgi:Delta-aminolevulinic acid dehydratase|nr:MAG: porphobilinogen synthase [Pseudomonadota bacterium]
MGFPLQRPRRLRRTETWRRLVRETTLSADDFVYPLFIVPGRGVRRPVSSMPGIAQLSVDEAVREARTAFDAGVRAVILFAAPAHKDPAGSAALDPDGLVPQTIKAIKAECPDLVVWTDVCLCSATDHGHCGHVTPAGEIDNDSSVETLAKVALTYARAGADAVAPSDMMDGRVLAMRRLLDSEGLSHVPIVSYAAKYASSFYGPFREAAESAPAFGDRRSYQMDPPNVREALREVLLDVEEGADLVMVKPAGPYLDVIRCVRDAVNVPVVAYQVSGEFSLIKAAAERGWIDERAAAFETLTGIKRAGADLIITYYAVDMARWLRS